MPLPHPAARRGQQLEAKPEARSIDRRNTGSGATLPRRIHIAGGSGTGKSTLARRLGDLLDVPVYQLDYVARDFEVQRVRSEEERLAMVNEIAASPSWVTDGIHVGWTDVLFREADLIVWLDQVSWPVALMRVVRRFIRGGIDEARRQRGVRRFFRPRSYVRHAVELYRVSREIRTFGGDAPGSQPGDGGSRAAIAAQIRPYANKVRHCRSTQDVDALVAHLAADIRQRSSLTAK